MSIFLTLSHLTLSMVKHAAHIRGKHGAIWIIYWSIFREGRSSSLFLDAAFLFTCAMLHHKYYIRWRRENIDSIFTCTLKWTSKEEEKKRKRKWNERSVIHIHMEIYRYIVCWAVCLLVQNACLLLPSEKRGFDHHHYRCQSHMKGAKNLNPWVAVIFWIQTQVWKWG